MGNELARARDFYTHHYRRLDPECSYRSSRSDQLSMRLSRKRFEEMVEEATVDCYNDSELITGWYTMIDDNLQLPFKTTVLGVPVVVDQMELTETDQIVARCTRGAQHQWVPILDLPLPTPGPLGSDWIEAYRRWLRT